jgi:signal transduction histidine kinase
MFPASLMTMPSEDTSFVRLVSLAVHDLRTPLATASGFAKTLERGGLEEPASRYVEIMIAACDQLAELLEDLGTVARIDDGRWEPNVQEANTRELARAAQAVAEGTVRVEGDGGPVHADVEAAERALYSLARCAVRHGGLEELKVTADGNVITMTPVTPEAAPILLAENLRDFGAAVAMRIVPALGGSVEVDGDRLIVRLPT